MIYEKDVYAAVLLIGRDKDLVSSVAVVQRVIRQIIIRF